MRWSVLLMACGLCCIAVVAGCGGGGGKDTNSVKGKVTFSDGSPLTKGMVIFASAENTAQGEIQSDGSYALGSYGESDGAPAGSYKVFLAGPIFGSDADETEPEEAPSEGGDEELEMYDEGIPEAGEALVHQKFSAPDTSGLTCEVSGSTTFDITVEKP